MTEPFFSIVIATRNPGEKIRSCAESVNEQTCLDYEVLISDGGSTDGTVEFIRGGAIRNLSWYRSGGDRGIYDALNRALPDVKGRWLMVIGADDRLAGPSTMASAKAALMRLDPAVGLVYGDLIINSSGTRKLKKYPPYGAFREKYSNYPPIHHQSVIMRMDVVRKVGFFRHEQYGIHADYEFVCRAMDHTAVAKIDGPLVEYSDRGYSSRIGNVFQSIREIREIRSGLGVDAFPAAYALLYARHIVKLIVRKGLPPVIYRNIFQRA